MSNAEAQRSNRMFDKLARMTEVAAERARAGQDDQRAEPMDATAMPCKGSKADESPDFFPTTLYDIGARDSHAAMDVATFRLSKKDRRPNDVIRYELSDGYVEVTSAGHGMASVWDYDIVLMAISHLTEAMNRFHDGKGPKPGPDFKPHISEVLKFCRRENGGKQRDQISGALDRLASTYVSIRRTRKIKNKLMTIKTGETLIASHTIIENSKTGKVEFIEIKIAGWMYREIAEGRTFNVLSIHPDYFLIEQGVGRYIYRLARRAAGKTTATWGFQTLYERSGSTGSFHEFCRILRKIIAMDNFPDYHLAVIKGQKGLMLVMTYKTYGEAVIGSSVEKRIGINLAADNA